MFWRSHQRPSNDRSFVSKVKTQGQAEWILKPSFKLVRTWLTMTCWGSQWGSMSLGTYPFWQRKLTDALLNFFFNQHWNKVGFSKEDLGRTALMDDVSLNLVEILVQLSNSLSHCKPVAMATKGTHTWQKSWLAFGPWAAPRTQHQADERAAESVFWEFGDLWEPEENVFAARSRLQVVKDH